MFLHYLKLFFVKLFVVLLSTSCFCSLGSSDGSSFVTKAEFDTLKEHFKKEVENYENSINDKIDGAIAQYLAGIQLKKAAFKAAPFAPTDGIYCLGSNDYRWSAGWLSYKVNGVVGRIGHNNTTTDMAVINVQYTSGTSSKFKEALVSDADYTNNVAKWKGYYETTQSITLNPTTENPGFSPNTGYWESGGKLYFLHAGPFAVDPKNGTDLFANSALISFDSTWAVSNVGYWSTTNYLRSKGTDAVTKRTLGDLKSASYITTNDPTITNAFYNYDHISEWCSQNAKSLPTYTTDATTAALGGSVSGTVYYSVHNGGACGTISPTTTGLGTYNNWDGGSDCKTKRRMAFGPIYNVNTWGQIYTEDYDSKIDSIFLEADALKSSNIITVSNKKHLKVSGGVPLGQFDKNIKVTYEFKFKDTSKNYCVWLKDCAFDGTKKLSTQYGTCVKPTKLYGYTTFDETYKCIKVSNGYGKVDFETGDDEKCYWVKWCEGTTANIDAGGGTFLPSSSIEYIDIS